MLEGRSIICFAHDWKGDDQQTHIMRILARRTASCGSTRRHAPPSLSKADCAAWRAKLRLTSKAVSRSSRTSSSAPAVLPCGDRRGRHAEATSCRRGYADCASPRPGQPDSLDVNTDVHRLIDDSTSRCQHEPPLRAPINGAVLPDPWATGSPPSRRNSARTCRSCSVTSRIPQRAGAAAWRIVGAALRLVASPTILDLCGIDKPAYMIERPSSREHDPHACNDYAASSIDKLRHALRGLPAWGWRSCSAAPPDTGSIALAVATLRAAIVPGVPTRMLLRRAGATRRALVPRIPPHHAGWVRQRASLRHTSLPGRTATIVAHPALGRALSHGWGELEIHLHQASTARPPETESTLAASGMRWRKRLPLTLERQGPPVPFVHGNWRWPIQLAVATAASMGNGSCPDGCYADLTRFRRANPAQIAKINALSECELPLSRERPTAGDGIFGSERHQRHSR